MSRITILNLETLCWIERLGSFNAAAEHLNTTQPAISKRVKDLEQALGVSLFHRQGRRMELTIQGRDLVHRAQPLLMELKDIVIFSKDLSATTGLIRIGVGEIMAVTWLSQLVVQLTHLMPRIRYELNVGLATDMRQRLEEGLLDVAFLPAAIDSSKIVSTPIGDVNIVWAISAKLARASATTFARAQEILEAHPIWCVARPSHMRPMVMETLRSHGLNQMAINTSDNLQSIVEIVANGGGIAMLPELLITNRLLSKELILLSESLKPQRLEFVVAHHRDQNQLIIRKIVDEALQTSVFLKR